MPSIQMEIRERDSGGRICRLTVKGRKLITPLFLPVYNPGKPIITPREFREEFKLEAMMTNAYIIYRRDEARYSAVSEGIHRFLGFDGIIFTDSGAYQMFRGKLEVSQEEIIRFQESIGSDVGVMLDVPSRHEGRREVYESVIVTARRAREWYNIRKGDGIIWEGAIQGGGYPDLVELSCRYMSRYPFDIYAVGVPPRLWKEYKFMEIASQGVVVVRSLPAGRLRHAFGIGHPMAIPLLVAVGYDIFDSASYALYAEDDRYMTEYGTKKLDRLKYLPCSCPVCRSVSIEELKSMDRDGRVKLLAKHNLYVILREVELVKQAIHEGRLWELVAVRARSHPMLLEAMYGILRRYGRYYEKLDPITKRSALLYTGCEVKLRPDYRRAIKRLESRLGTSIAPRALRLIWPFGQHESPVEIFRFDERNYGDLETVRILADYQFGYGVGVKLFPDNCVVEKSRRTGRIRRVWLEGELLATVRPRDGFLLLQLPAAMKLTYAIPGRRYKVRLISSYSVEERVAMGGDVLGWHILEADPLIVPGEVTVILNNKGRVLAVGEALLSGIEMSEIRRGIAVRVRDFIGRRRYAQPC
ncbi:MAG: tRNA guanosine(15) transglycosylase TgtA [Nitrososphaerota archaeon]|nr:tRNA guanosine(15) transglycosylase TgtA [Nitrososphaerota archaeon]